MMKSSRSQISLTRIHSHTFEYHLTLKNELGHNKELNVLLSKQSATIKLRLQLTRSIYNVDIDIFPHGIGGC